MTKPRLKYQEMKPTVAQLIQRYINESRQPGGKELGETHMYNLLRLQRSKIGRVVAAELKPADFIEHCRSRIAEGVMPATVMHDITCMRNPLTYATVGWDMPDVTVAPLLSAMPLLTKYNLIGKSKARTRRPTPEEIEKRMEYFREQDKGCRIKMAVVDEFGRLTARRISEICRLKWGDVDFERRMCWVRDLKDPKQKKGNDAEFPLLGRAWDLLLEQPRLDPTNPEERIFPYRSASCSARSTAANKALGIKGLRLHDNRRECASRMMEDGFSVPEVMKETLHKNPTILLKNYTSLKGEDLHKGPASKRQ